MNAGINTKPPIGLLRFTPRPIDAETIPIGSRVRLPSGQTAVVLRYQGYKRQHRVRLVCRYEKPRNKHFNIVMVLPELVEVIHGT